MMVIIMNLEYFINNMLEKINRAELNLYLNKAIDEDLKHIDKKRGNRI